METMNRKGMVALTCFGLGLSTWIVTEFIMKRERKVLRNPEIQRSCPTDIKDELLSRVKTFFGNEGLEKLSNSFVVVVGLGGVGSHAAHMLCRSGVGKLRLIDFDQVTLSSLNRHAVATMEDVGIPKAQAMKNRLISIVPWCNIEDYTEMFVMSEADRLLSGKPDLVLDCIDDVNTKAELIAYCKNNDIPVLTSMGAGGKSDPTRMRISPLSDCINDPLAQKIKWKLKKHHIAPEDVMSVFSIEKPVCELLPLDDEQKNAPQDFGAVDYLRLRVIPVLGTSPSIFGQTMAAYTLCKLGGKLFEPEACERLSKNLKHKLRQVFRNNEIKRFGREVEEVNLDDEDVEFVVQQVWKSRCAITQKRFGGHIILTLTRWNSELPPTPYNLVLLMQNEAQKFAEQGFSAFQQDVVDKINLRLAWAKEICEDSWDNPNQLVPVVSKNKTPPQIMNYDWQYYNSISFLLMGFGLGSILTEKLL